jgi:predicted RNA binding protein YcfA (HicA-like mRNA interferase family)
MAKLPRDVSGRQAVRAFQKAGWLIRKAGPHIIMEKEGMRPTLSVPNHKVLDPGILRSLIRHSGLTIEEFIHLLK